MGGTCEFWGYESRVSLTCDPIIFGGRVYLFYSKINQNFSITPNGEYAFCNTTGANISLYKMDTVGKPASVLCEGPLADYYCQVRTTADYYIFMPNAIIGEKPFYVPVDSCIPVVGPATLFSIWQSLLSDVLDYFGFNYSRGYEDYNNSGVFAAASINLSPIRKIYILISDNGNDWTRQYVTGADYNAIASFYISMVPNLDASVGGMASIPDITTNAASNPVPVVTSNKDCDTWTKVATLLTFFDGVQWDAFKHLAYVGDKMIFIATDNVATEYYVVLNNNGTVYSHKFLGPISVRLETVFSYDSDTGRLFGIFFYNEYFTRNRHLLYYSDDFGITWNLKSNFMFDEYEWSTFNNTCPPRIRDGYITLAGNLSYLAEPAFSSIAEHGAVVQYKLDEITSPGTSCPGFCLTTNCSMEESKEISPTEICVPSVPELIYTDAIICGHTWYVQNIGVGCGGHTASTIYFTASTDVVVKIFENNEFYDTREIFSGIEKEIFFNTNSQWHFELIHGILNGEEIEEDPGSGTVDIKIKYDPPPITDFILTMRTTTVDETIELALPGTNNFEIDWGDDTIETITSILPEHTYAVADDYTISINGICTHISFDNVGSDDNIISVNNLGVIGLTNLDYAFKGCSNLETFIAGNTDTSNVTSMISMLNSLPSLSITPDLTTIDTSAVQDMSGMLTGLTALLAPPDLSNFNTVSVLNMSGMLRTWTIMLTPPDLTNFNTSNVTDMSNMMMEWDAMTIPPDLSGFNTGSVTTMNRMMYDWGAMLTPPDLTSFNTSNVTDMAYMMAYWPVMTIPPDLSGFDTSKVTTMDHMMIGWNSMGEIDIAIDTWDITSLLNAVYMLLGVTLTTACYDRTLIAWAAQAYQSNVSAHFGNSRYTAGGAAESARNTLLAAGWTITDNGSV